MPIALPGCTKSTLMSVQLRLAIALVASALPALASTDSTAFWGSNPALLLNSSTIAGDGEELPSTSVTWPRQRRQDEAAVADPSTPTMSPTQSPTSALQCLRSIDADGVHCKRRVNDCWHSGVCFDGVETHDFQYWRQAWYLVAVAYPQCSCGMLTTSSPSASPTLSPTPSLEQRSIGAAGCGASIGSPEICAMLATGQRCATEPEVAAICAAECCDPDAEDYGDGSSESSTGCALDAASASFCTSYASLCTDAEIATMCSTTCCNVGVLLASASSVAPTPAPAQPAGLPAPVTVLGNCDPNIEEAFCLQHATPANCLSNPEYPLLCATTCCHITLPPTGAPSSSAPSTSPSNVPSYNGDCPIQIDLMILLGKQMSSHVTLPEPPPSPPAPRPLALSPACHPAHLDLPPPACTLLVHGGC